MPLLTLRTYPINTLTHTTYTHIYIQHREQTHAVYTMDTHKKTTPQLWSFVYYYKNICCIIYYRGRKYGGIYVGKWYASNVNGSRSSPFKQNKYKIKRSKKKRKGGKKKSKSSSLLFSSCCICICIAIVIFHHSLRERPQRPVARTRRKVDRTRRLLLLPPPYIIPVCFLNSTQRVGSSSFIYLFFPPVFFLLYAYIH